jgi:hypothetical protein
LEIAVMVLRTRRRASRLPFLALSLLATACGSASNSAAPAPSCDSDASHPQKEDAGGNAGSEAGTVVAEAAAPSEASSPGALGFNPSNVSVPTFPSVQDLTFSVPDCTIDTSALKIDCIKPDADGGLPYAFSTAMQSDGSQVAVLFAHSVMVQQGAGVSVKGTLPLVLVAATTVNLQGTVQSATPGNAGGPQVTQSGAGGGPGGGAGGNHLGAGGGGYCGTGGQGAVNDDASTPAPGGRSYGNAPLAPLIGGSAGGNHGDYNDGGEGGGAIQITAGTSITVGTLGTLNVPGYGGANVGGGGGGSGGGILLEAPEVTIDGIVAANGGGAGLATANSSGSGQTGQPSALPAAGGDVTEGAGGAGTTINGADGHASGGHAGSGGGAAGRIRINTTSGAATIGASAIVSPAASTTCTSQGMLAK